LPSAEWELFGDTRLEKMHLTSNTAAAKTAEEAVGIEKLAKASGLCDMVKVKVIGCDRTLLPNPVETLKATEELLKKDSLYYLTRLVMCSLGVWKSLDHIRSCL
jgi:thiazole synthase ThiGH ThiG subunit